MEPSEVNDDCPKEVLDAVTQILQESIVWIRMGGSADDPDYCFCEANHIHNLPVLLRHYSRTRLESYLDYAQGRYTDEFQRRFSRPPTALMPHWQMLRDFLEATATKGNV